MQGTGNIICILQILYSQFMSGILFEVSSLDPVTYVLGALFMIGVTLLASLLPASRATRIDPVRCLRYE